MAIKPFQLAIAMACSMLFLSRCQFSKEFQDDDTSLFSAATDTVGFHYYKGDSAIKHSSPQSGHKKYFRLRYNSIALAALNDSGHLPVGGSFPNGSVMVKELYDTSNGPLKAYAIIKKEPGGNLAANGWLWGEYYSSGAISGSINEKGSQCTNCHSINSRDYNRVFDIFP